MELIENNPFRIAGVLSNATERELQKQQTKIKAYSKVRKEIKSDFDFHILDNITRTEESIEKAFSSIEQNHDKVNNALFWFLNSNPFDNTAIEYLKKGNSEKAIEIWEKVTSNKEVNSKNFSAFNNLGTFKLLSHAQADISEGIEAKIKLVESDFFKNFVHSVADETFTIDNEKQIEKFIDVLLSQLKHQYSSSETFQLFRGCNSKAQQYLSKKITEQPILNIETKIEKCKKKRKADNYNAFEFGLSLFNNTKGDLSLLKSLLGTSDIKYKGIADQLANEIMQCGIDYFNASHEIDSHEDFLKNAQNLNKNALSIAVGSLVRDRAKDHIATLEEMKDQEVNQAIEFLQSIKETYEENEVNIRNQIEELKKTDYEIKFGLKTINYSAVEDNIRNCIDWSKVNEILESIFDINHLRKIKKSNKTDLKNELWELMCWLKDNSLKSDIISRIINNYKNIQPNLCFKIISAEITNSDSGPINELFYVENIRYVGLKLNIISTGNQKITIYKKYINPNGRYKHNSKNSPKGYTNSSTKTITPSSRVIDLVGYGNGSECTYQVGEHKLEIYVDHYKIYTKTFKVDWSPNKKSELKKRLTILQKELAEVNDFKWFRGTETKEKEVKEVKDKIDKLNNILMNK